MKKYKIIAICVLFLFVAFVIIEVNRSSKIPEHIHSIDDKSAEQRTDEENITISERTLQKEPKNINVMLQLTDLYLKTNQKSSAVKMIEKILEIDPSNQAANDKLKLLN